MNNQPNAPIQKMMTVKEIKNNIIIMADSASSLSSVMGHILNNLKDEMHSNEDLTNLSVFNTLCVQTNIWGMIKEISSISRKILENDYRKILGSMDVEYIKTMNDTMSGLITDFSHGIVTLNSMVEQVVDVKYFDLFPKSRFVLFRNTISNEEIMSYYENI